MISLENLARIVSTHYEEAKRTAKKMDALESHIEVVRNELNALEDSLTDMGDPIEDMDNLISDITDEMTVDERLNFKRLAGIE